MVKTKKLFIFICMMMCSLTISATPQSIPSVTNEFPLKMQNQTNKDVQISFKNDIGMVYFDIPLEDNTLLASGQYSNTYGVNYAPRNPSATFKIIFNTEQECIFTVGYFKPPAEPKVTISGNGCRGAGYRIEQQHYQTLVLYVSDKSSITF